MGGIVNDNPPRTTLEGMAQYISDRAPLRARNIAAQWYGPGEISQSVELFNNRVEAHVLDRLLAANRRRRVYVVTAFKFPLAWCNEDLDFEVASIPESFLGRVQQRYQDRVHELVTEWERERAAGTDLTVKFSAGM